MVQSHRHPDCTCDGEDRDDARNEAAHSIAMLEAALRHAVLGLRRLDGMTGDVRSRNAVVANTGYDIAKALGMGRRWVPPARRTHAAGAAGPHVATIRWDAHVWRLRTADAGLDGRMRLLRPGG